jgi:membrane protein
MANPVSWIIEKVMKINDAVWHTSLSEISKGKSFIFKQLRIIILAARGFYTDKVQLRASALTLYTFLSIIPVAAIAFAIAKGFGLDQNLTQLLTKEFKNQPEVMNWILKEATMALQQTKGGYIAGVGVIILFWSVMSLLDQIESSFNHIWQIGESRPWFRKFTDYLTIMLIAPIFLILSSSITVIISTNLPQFIASSSILDFFKPIVSFLIKLSPYFLSWVALTILFIIIPNTKVKFVPALMAGIVTGTVLQILQWLYIDLQFGISKLSSIYGSFAAIPLFIVWVQTSWIILLIGAELSFANQNVSRYEFESGALNVSHFQKRALSVMIMNMIIKSFAAGEKPVSAEDISVALKAPVRLVRELLQDLDYINLVSVIHESEHEERLYQPAMDINKLTVSYVLEKIDKKGSTEQIFVKNSDYDRITSMLDKFNKLAAKSDSNVLIKDILE